MKNLIYLPLFLGTYVILLNNNTCCNCKCSNTVQAAWVGGVATTDLDSTIQPKDSTKVQKQNYTVYKSSRILSTKELREAKRKRDLEQKKQKKREISLE